MITSRHSRQSAAKEEANQVSRRAACRPPHQPLWSWPSRKQEVTLIASSPCRDIVALCVHSLIDVISQLTKYLLVI